VDERQRAQVVAEVALRILFELFPGGGKALSFDQLIERPAR
jgi:hypothetical protein